VTRRHRSTAPKRRAVGSLAATPCELPLRITVAHPPYGVTFRVQRGRDELLPPAQVSEETLSFDLSVRVDLSQDGRPNFLGEFAQGLPQARFVYVNSGTRAGQMDSCWDRRAKVSLMGITSAQIASVLASGDRVLEGRIGGTACDGGPACATVPLLAKGWQVTQKSHPR